jgi:hypothetical protein
MADESLLPVARIAVGEFVREPKTTSAQRTAPMSTSSTARSGVLLKQRHPKVAINIRSRSCTKMRQLTVLFDMAGNVWQWVSEGVRRSIMRAPNFSSSGAR